MGIDISGKTAPSSALEGKGVKKRWIEKIPQN